MSLPPPQDSSASGHPPDDQVVPPEGPRTLGVFAHPDDETLTGGAILATMARRGHTTVVTSNRGERGEVIGADLQHLRRDQQGLGRHRAGELSGALAALGVQEHHFLDEMPGLAAHRPAIYTDSGMQWPPGETAVRAVPADDVDPQAFSLADAEVSARLLAALIRTQRPDLVLTDEPSGGYGHPDHVQAHRVTMRAVELAATEDLQPLDDDDPTIGTRAHRVPVVAWVVRPAGQVRRALDWLAGHEDRVRISEHTGDTLQVADGRGSLPTIVRPDEDVDLDAPLAPEVLRSLGEAMACHRTQVQTPHVDPDLVDVSEGSAAGWFALSNDVLQPVPARATAMVAPGWGSAEQLRALFGTGSKAAAGAPAAGMRPAEPDDAALEEGPEHPAPRWYSTSVVAMAALLGLLVGSVGTAFHRWERPFGLLLALLVVFTASVLARTLAEIRGQLTYVGVLFVVVLALTYLSNGDVIVAGDAVGITWLLAAPAVGLLGVTLPRRWFRDG